MSGIRKQAWQILINTNSKEKRLGGPLKKVWNHVLENMTTFCYGKKGAKILKVKEDTGLEVGPEKGFIHIHGYVEITSNGELVFLNYSEIKKFIDKQLRRLPGYVGCKFECKLIQNYNAIENIVAYNHKGELDVEDVEDEFSKFEVE